MKKIVLIPAYKPSRAMTELIRDLKAASFEVIAVNDGSGSNYNQLFAQAADFGTVLCHEINKGKGAALKTGLKYIMENFESPYIVVTADADGQHLKKDIIKVCDEAQKHTDAFITGCRILDSSVPLRSKFGNTVTRFVFSLSSGKKIYDTQTGLRAFSDEFIPELLELNGERYEYEMNVLMKLAKEKKDIIEIPIETVYLDKNNSASHFKAVRDSYRIYKEILKFSASSLICFCVDYLLFCLLINLTGILVLSNILSRVLSSVLNFSLNRNIVFKSNSSLILSMIKYFALAAVILLLNTILVKVLCKAGLSAYVAKILTESILFILSWLVQHKLVFRRRLEK